MPALMTHYMFGEQALAALPEGLVATEAQRTACLLGNQGPDPFFFAVTTTRGQTIRALGNLMHNQQMAQAFDALRSSVGLLPQADRGVGAAFVCGLFGHYVLDRTAHPYVYAHEFALCDNNPELSDAYHEVHALIESDIDGAMLRIKHQADVVEFPPVSVLKTEPEVLRAAGALMAQCANAVFGLPLHVSDYPDAVADMRLCYRAIEPAGSRRNRRVAAAERMARPHSQMASLAHRASVSADDPSMNPERRPWVDPFGGEESTDSFVDRFEKAQTAYRLLLPQLLDGCDMRELTRGIDYEGRVHDADEGPLPEDPSRPL